MKHWARKLVTLFFSGSPLAQYLKMLALLAIGGAAWLFGGNLLDWWFRPTQSRTQFVITGVLSVLVICLLLALQCWFWVNSLKIARTIVFGSLGILLRMKRQQKAQKAKSTTGTDRGHG